MKLLKRILLIVFVLLVFIQFIPNQKPPTSEDTKNDITISDNVKNDVATVIKTSCYDCHSNQTHYPWYAYVAPVSWLVVSDVKEGRRKLNFSEWGLYDKRHKIKKLSDIKEEVDDNEMPMSIYTMIHRNAKLSESQKDMIIKWSQDLGNSILDKKE